MAVKMMCKTLDIVLRYRLTTDCVVVSCS